MIGFYKAHTRYCETWTWNWFKLCKIYRYLIFRDSALPYICEFYIGVWIRSLHIWHSTSIMLPMLFNNPVKPRWSSSPNKQSNQVKYSNKHSHALVTVGITTYPHRDTPITCCPYCYSCSVSNVCTNPLVRRQPLFWQACNFKMFGP